MSEGNRSDVRLVAADLDGTLLDGDGKIPVALWPLLEQMRQRGVLFAPASGRSYTTLRQLFHRAARGMPFISDNGAYVMLDGRELSATPLERQIVEVALAVLDEHVARTAGTAPPPGESGMSAVGVVLCGRERAYVRRSDAELSGRAREYYVDLQEVDDFAEVDDEILKLAIVDPFGAQRNCAPALAPLSDRCRVVVSADWALDLFALDVSKGHALAALQDRLGITPNQTAAFGDFHNDIEMLAQARHSFAMENAHPDVKRQARYVAPANTEHGVITTLRELLGIADAEAG